VVRFRDTRGRDRAWCLCYALFAVGDLLATSSLAVVYAVRHSDEGTVPLVGDFVRDALANPAAGFVYADLTLVWIVLAVFMVVEARRLGIRHVWVYVVAAPLSALSFSFPAFMFVRQLKIAAPGVAGETATSASDRAMTRSTHR
jgi:hypothetical protein